MDPVTLATILIPVAVIVLFILIRMFRVIPEYERGISFRFGHLRSELKPGLNVVFPLVDSLQRVDMRVITLTIPPQEVITKDNVPAVDLDTLLAHREDLNEDLRSIIGSRTEHWGIQVELVEIKDVEIPEAMQRAMAREAEAERERRAKIISARGELEASSELKEASDILSQSPASLQLRYLQTLLELGADQNSTVVFPLPMDVIGPLVGALKGESK